MCMMLRSRQCLRIFIEQDLEIVKCNAFKQTQAEVQKLCFQVCCNEYLYLTDPWQGPFKVGCSGILSAFIVQTPALNGHVYLFTFIFYRVTYVEYNMFGYIIRLVFHLKQISE